MKVIFLDIDGVLNCSDYFTSMLKKINQFYELLKHNPHDIDLLVKRQMMDIDYSKLVIIKNIVIETGAKIVIISSWKNLRIYPYVQKKLIDLGIPVIDITIDNGSDRGTGIKKYLNQHKIDEYVIIDDEIFDDYDETILNKLVKTNFYNGGLQEKHELGLIKRLKK